MKILHAIGWFVLRLLIALVVFAILHYFGLGEYSTAAFFTGCVYAWSGELKK